jgi:hypothetical protein
MPEKAVEGNGFSMVQYSANGEASDWMLGKHGIYALSPELGTDRATSEEFFIKSPTVLRDTIKRNYHWIFYTILKLVPK